MSARFTLDETKAAEWLAAEIAAHDRWIDGEEGASPGELDFGSDYSPHDDYDGIDTTNLVCAARDELLITGPGEIWYESVNDGDCGYCWIVYLAGTGSLKFSTYYAKSKNLGDGTKGASGALAVLRQAVSAANGLLDDLDAYIASRNEDAGEAALAAGEAGTA